LSKILIFPVLLLGIISVLIPNAMANDDEFEINQEKVLELNTQCNIPILAVQKSAECNANVEQANCEAMGMRTNEQGQCEDIDIFGDVAVAGSSSGDDDDGGSSAAAAASSGDDDGEGGNSEQGHSQSQSHEPKHEQEHEGSGE
jgi:hypothetical protein